MNERAIWLFWISSTLFVHEAVASRRLVNVYVKSCTVSVCGCSSQVFRWWVMVGFAIFMWLQNLISSDWWTRHAAFHVPNDHKCWIFIMGKDKVLFQIISNKEYGRSFSVSCSFGRAVLWWWGGGELFLLTTVEGYLQRHLGWWGTVCCSTLAGNSSAVAEELELI